MSFPNSRRPKRCLNLYVFQALLLSTLAASTEARTWYVNLDGTGDAPTIQAAVDSARAGDDVLLAPGTYTEGGVGFPYFAKVVITKEGSAPQKLDSFDPQLL